MTDKTEEFSNSSKKKFRSRSMVKQGNLSIPLWVQEKFADKFLRFFRYEQSRMNAAHTLGYTAVSAKQNPDVNEAIGDIGLFSERGRSGDLILRTGKLGNQQVLMMIDKDQKDHYRREQAAEVDDLERGHGTEESNVYRLNEDLSKVEHKTK